MIQVPNKLITDKKISSMILYLFAMIRTLESNGIVNVVSDDLLMHLNWRDFRTLKKYLAILKDFQMIYFDFDTVRHKQMLSIYINKVDTPFTQVNINKIYNVIYHGGKVLVKKNKVNKIEDVKELCLRLYFYYEFRYDVGEGRGYPSFEDIYNDTGIDKKYIVAINNMFVQNNILKIISGRCYVKDGNIQKYRNSYILNDD